MPLYQDRSYAPRFYYNCNPPTNKRTHKLASRHSMFLAQKFTPKMGRISLHNSNSISGSMQFSQTMDRCFLCLSAIPIALSFDTITSVRWGATNSSHDYSVSTYSQHVFNHLANELPLQQASPESQGALGRHFEIEARVDLWEVCTWHILTYKVVVPPTSEVVYYRLFRYPLHAFVSISSSKQARNRWSS